MAAVADRITLLCGLAAAQLFCAAHAGPPFITDDPEPTPNGRFENYLFVEGTHAGGANSYPVVGAELNYGASANLQLTGSLPLCLNPGAGGLGQVWAPLGGGVKLRFIQEDENGWRPQIGIFPQLSIPYGPASHREKVTGLLPVWMQKSFGAWTSFGGGGYNINPGAGNRNFYSYGWALQRQLDDRLALGLELFGKTRDSDDGRASTALGLGGIFDLSRDWHLVGSFNTRIAGGQASDYFSYNLALKWTN
jgi:hypothetical protein